MANPKWSIRGPHLANCNCDAGCPCQFNSLPTHRNCQAVVAWRIDDGYWEDIRLDGLMAVGTYSWPGAVHEGNGSVQYIIDERASPAQRQALTKVLAGIDAEPGAIMLQIYRAMCATEHEPLFRPIELTIDMDGRKGRLRVPGLIDTTVEPIRNPVTGAETRARIDLPLGKEFFLAEVARGTTNATGKVPLAFKDSHAHIVNNAMTSSGPRP